MSISSRDFRTVSRRGPSASRDLRTVSRCGPSAWLVPGLVLALVLVFAGLPAAMAPPPARAFAPLPTSELDWDQVASGGITEGDNGSILTLEVFDGALYAGTYNLLGCHLYRYDGARWEMLVGEGLPTYRSPGFGNSENDTIISMAVFEGALYMGIYNEDTGCELWRHNGTDYEKLVGVGRPGFQASGFGNPDNYSISAMAAMGEYLYLGTYNQDGCELWRYDGTDFEEYWVLGPGFGDADNRMVRCMAVYNNALYLGTQNVIDGCDVWRCDGIAFTQVVGQEAAGTFGTGPGFGDDHNKAASSMAEHRGNLYVGTSNADGCEVWLYAGAGWAMAAGPALPGTSGPGFGDTGNTSVNSLASYGSFLYAGTHNITGEGGQIWRTDVSGWTAEADGGLGNPFNNPINAMCEYGSALYAATSNWPEGGEVYSAAHNFYFAEGYTGSGFQEYLCLGNPEIWNAHATITYMFEDGSTQSDALTVPARSRATVDVNGAVGPGKSVSARVQCDQPISVERPMYFDYTPTLAAGSWTGGHDAVGATSLSNYWYFAEGYTGPGFEEWICVLNPGDEAADLTFRFQVEGMEEPVVIADETVAPHSRASFLVNDLLGTGCQASLALESSEPVVAERPMYFDYLGAEAPKHWTGGHCVMGTPTLAARYYFAEGCTRPDFDEYVTIQNPGIMPITVDAVYQPAAGQGGNIEESYTLMPGTRHTVHVPDVVGMDKDLSVQLTSAGPFLAERPMYFRYTGYGAPGWTGGHCVIGAAQPAAEWFFAEGFTGTGFQEYLTLQNPGDAASDVEITYYVQEDGALPPLEPVSVTVPSHARLTVYVNESAGAGLQLSCRVRVTAGPDIVAERPMYFDYGPGWTGGHCVVGLVP